jgi:hypothetical protein
MYETKARKVQRKVKAFENLESPGRGDALEGVVFWLMADLGFKISLE